MRIRNGNGSLATKDRNEFVREVLTLIHVRPFPSSPFQIFHFHLGRHYRARQYIQHPRAQRRALHDHSFYFCTLRSSLVIAYDAARPVAGSTIPRFVSLSISPGSHLLLVEYWYLFYLVLLKIRPIWCCREPGNCGLFPIPFPFAWEKLAHFPFSFRQRICEAAAAHFALALSVLCAHFRPSARSIYSTTPPSSVISPHNHQPLTDSRSRTRAPCLK